MNDSELVAGLIGKLRAEEPEWGHLPAAMRFKQELVSSLGVAAAFEAGRGALSVPGTECLRKRRVRSLLEAARQDGRAYTEIWAGGTPFTHPEPKVVGESDHAAFCGVNRTGYLACLDNVSIRGRSAVILRGDDALVDFEGDERGRFEDNPEYDPGILHASRDEFWTMEPAAPAFEVEEAFMLSGSHTLDFGHWLTEYLPKLGIALMAGLPAMPVLIDRHIPNTLVQSLQLILPQGTELIVIPHLAPCRVGRLWFASNPMYMGFYPTNWSADTWTGMATDAGRFAAAIRTVKEGAAPATFEPTGVDRLFLARDPKRRKKRLHNHRDIEAAAAARGFRIVYPEDVSFRDQLRLAHHARHIVAPEGSNGFLAFFTRPGTKTCILSPPHTFPLADINAMLSALDVDNTILTGPVVDEDPDWPFWNGYRIDETGFGSFLDHWLERD